MEKPLLGAHVSAAGGLYKAVESGERIGARTIQIFGASPRQWAVRGHSDEDIERYKEALDKSPIASVYLHGAYLVNLGTPKDDLYKKSVDNLSAHFEVANKIGAKGLVFHIGSSKDSEPELSRKRVVDGMNQVLKRVKGDSYLIMENASGGGGKIGSEIEEIGDLLRAVGSGRVKVCLDTAHAFEAGVMGVSKEDLKKFFDDWEEKVGMDNLVVIHANDSKTEFGSFSDRHENIGEGHIGMEGFQNLASDKRLWDKEWILEVPGFDGGGPDKKNLDILKGLFN